MDKKIILRDATATIEEGLIFARYLDEAAEGFFRFMLGRNSADIIARAFTKTDHDLSHQNVTFAECDGHIVGMISGYTAQQHRGSSFKPVKQDAGRWNLRIHIVSLLVAPFMRIIDSIADDDFYLQAIAVDKELRGEGIGSMLMNFIEDKARLKGADRLALAVSAKNEGARRFYERRGFTVESEWPKRLRIPALTFYRMTMTLK